jgi:ferrochelatase
LREGAAGGHETSVRTDVVVLNFGGPQGEAEVEPFLFELFDDPDVIQLPFGPRFQRFFAGQLSHRRTPKIGPHYAHIGFSPLVPTTLAQVEALKAALGPEPPRVHVAMRYGPPRTSALAEALAADPPDRLVAVALFPHWSGTTTGSSFNLLADSLRAVGLGRLPIHHVPAFYDHPAYVRAMVSRIEDAAAGVADRSAAHVLFSAHGLPSSYARDKGDPYPDQIKDSVRMIMRALDWPGAHGLCFQSRVGPVRWLEPSTEQALVQLAAEGTRDVIVVPISFTTEGIETLYEIDVEFGALAERLGLRLHRARTVDEHPDFIAALADTVRAAIADDRHGGLGVHRCVRCLLPRPHTHRTRVECLDCGHRTPRYLLALPPPS